MKRRCERCDYEIDAKYLLKQDSFDKIICPNCGRTLIVKDGYKLFTTLVFIIFFVVFLFLPLGYLGIIIIEAVWSIIYDEVLPAYIYIYEEIKNDADF